MARKGLSGSDGSWSWHLGTKTFNSREPCLVCSQVLWLKKMMTCKLGREALLVLVSKHWPPQGIQHAHQDPAFPSFQQQRIPLEFWESWFASHGGVPTFDFLGLSNMKGTRHFKKCRLQKKLTSLSCLCTRGSNLKSTATNCCMKVSWIGATSTMLHTWTPHDCMRGHASQLTPQEEEFDIDFGNNYTRTWKDGCMERWIDRQTKTNKLTYTEMQRERVDLRVPESQW